MSRLFLRKTRKERLKMAARRKDSKGRVLRDGESQRKNLTYQYRFTDPFGKRQCVYAQTLDELRGKEAEIQQKLLSGVGYTSAKPTVLELLDAYIELKKDELRRNTIYSYTATRKAISREAWSRRRACEIKVSDAKKWINALVTERGYGAGSVSVIKALLVSACQVAVDDDVLVKNPFRFEFVKSLYEKKERAYLTTVQQQHFLSFLEQDASYSKFYGQFYLCLKTGLRVGELMGLTEDDLDFGHSCVHVSRQVQELKGGGFYVSAPKSSSGIRVVPMLGEVTRILHEAIEANKNKKPYEIDGYSGFVFTTDAGSIKGRTRYNRELAACIRAYNSTHEEQLPHITMHCLRHSFCTTMAEMGIDPKHLQYLMGHATIEMTLDHYRHVSYDDIQRDVTSLVNTAPIASTVHQSYTNFAKNMRNYNKL